MADSPTTTTPDVIGNSAPLELIHSEVGQKLGQNIYTDLKYPYDILSNTTKYGGNYMVFHINQQNSTSLPVQNAQVKDTNGNPIQANIPASQRGTTSTRVGGTTKRTTTSIYLNIPDKLITNFGVNYSTPELGFAGNIANEVESLIKGEDQGGIGSDIKNILAQSGIQVAGLAGSAFIKGATEKLAAGVKSPAMKAIIGGLGEGAGNAAAAGAKSAAKLAQLAAGIAVNPFNELFFTNVDYRKFSFTFNLTATSAEEADQIERIITSFKFHMHPEIKGNAARYFTIPSEFDPEYYFNGKENPFLDFISSCVLTNVIVDYTSDGSFLTHHDGSPFSVDLTLEFQETEILTKNRIQEIYNDRFKRNLVDRITGKGVQ